MPDRKIGFERPAALCAALLALGLGAAPADLTGRVRAALAQHNLALGESEIQAYRARQGVTPEMLEALSWLGRGALAAGSLDQADSYANETRKLAQELLKKQSLDAERRLPLALGAAIEVHAQVLAARGERAQALDFLHRELAAWSRTSIGARIQKNINLLSLEGKPAPALAVAHWLGPKPPSLAALKGRPVLLFFWAHWCPDCKREVSDLARLEAEFRSKGLAILGPTQLYGYAARGEEASPEQELRYIDEVRKQFYAPLAAMPVPVSEENFKVYGASTTPTLVLIDRKGVVRMYHPGALPLRELTAQLEEVLGS